MKIVTAGPSTDAPNDPIRRRATLTTHLRQDCRAACVLLAAGLTQQVQCTRRVNLLVQGKDVGTGGFGTVRMPKTYTVAVTGATGLIGRALLPMLEKAGWKARVLSRAAGASAGASTAVVGDLREPAALQALVHGVDAVVHLAGVAHTTLRTPAEETAARAVNVEGTRALVATTVAAGVRRFVLISSAHVYAGQHGVNLDERSATSGDAAYAGMKLQAEECVQEAAKAKRSGAGLRPCLTYGPGVRYNLSALLRAVRGGYFVQVRGAATMRSLASVDTVGASIVHLVQRPELTGCYNVADRTPVQLEAWTKHLAGLMHVRPPWELSLGMLRALAVVGTAARRVGVPSPLTTGSLTKLTEPFSLSVERLAQTGFVWPQTNEQVLRQMIDAQFPPAPDAVLGEKAGRR